MFNFRRPGHNGGAVPPRRAYGRVSSTSRSKSPAALDESFVSSAVTPSRNDPFGASTLLKETRESTPGPKRDVKESVYVCPKFAPRRDAGEGLQYTFDSGDLTLYIPTETQDGKCDVENRRYKFAHTFGPAGREEDVFQHLWQQAEGKLTAGHNATILCFGQTGSGKTHTVNHLLPMMTDACFQLMQGQGAHMACKVEVSYLQIYMDSVFDLLGAQKDSKHGNQLDYKNKTIDALPKRYVQIESAAEAIGLVKKGNKWRATNAHALNDRSSRSHTLYFLTMTQNNTTTNTAMQSTLLIVDLAGSERVHKTKATGGVFEEGRAINKALTTLGRVMEGLAKGDRSIPYRENILTMYLRETLTNSFFSLICCCSSDGRDTDETRCTLKFGSVAKQVTITRKTNELLKQRTIAKEKQRKFEMTLANIEVQHGHQVNDLQQQIEANQRQGVRWQKEASDMRSKLVRERENLHHTEGKLTELTRELAVKELEAETSLQDLSMIQEKYDELLQEIKHEQDARQKAETQAKQLQKSLAATSRDLEETAHKVSLLQAEISSKSTEVNDAKETSHVVQRQLEGKHEELQQVRHLLEVEVEGKSELLDREAQLSTEIDTLDTELATAKQHLAEMQDERSQLTDALRRTEEESQSMKDEQHRIQGAMDDLRRTQSKLHEECTSLRRDRETAQSLAQRAMDDNRKISDLVREKEDEAERLRRQAEAVCQKADAEMKQARRLQKQLEQAEGKRVAAERDISLMDRGLKQAEQRLGDLEERNREKQASIASLEDKLRKEREQHQADVSYLQDQIEELEQLAARAVSKEEQGRELFEKEKEQLRREKEAAEEERRAAEEEREALLEECDSLRNTLVQRDDTLRKEKARAFRIQEHSNDLEVQLASECEGKTRLEEQAEQMADDHSAMLGQVENELARVRRDKDHFQEEYEDAAAEVDELREQLQQSQQRYLAQIEETSAAQAEQRRMGRKVQEFEGQLAAERDDSTRLRSDLNAIQTQLGSASLTEQEKKGLEVELHSTKEQLADSHDLVRQMEDDLTRLQDEHEAAVAMADSESRKCGQLSNECRTGMEELQTAWKDVQSLRASNRQILTDKRRLTKENDRMKRRVGTAHVREDDSKKLAAHQVKSTLLTRQVSKLDLQNKRLREQQRTEQVASRRLAAEVRAKESEMRHINEKYQREMRAKKTAKEKAEMKISMLEGKIQQMKKGIDKQATYIKVVADRVRESEKERDVLRYVLDQKDTFDYVKKGSCPNMRAVEPAMHRSRSASPTLRPQNLSHLRTTSRMSLRSASEASSVSGQSWGRPVRSLFSQPPSQVPAPSLSVTPPRAQPSQDRSRSHGYPQPQPRQQPQPRGQAATAPRTGGQLRRRASASPVVPAQPRPEHARRSLTTSHRVPSALFQSTSTMYGKPVATKIIRRTDSGGHPLAPASTRTRSLSRGSSMYSEQSMLSNTSARFAPLPVASPGSSALQSTQRSLTASMRLSPSRRGFSASFRR